MSDLTWKEFERVDIRVGTVTSAEPFPEDGGVILAVPDKAAKNGTRLA